VLFCYSGCGQYPQRILTLARAQCFPLGILLTLSFSCSAWADVIHLKNGKKLSVERVWEDGNKLRYEKDGNVFGFSKELVAKVEAGAYVPDPRDATAQIRDEPVLIEVLDETLDIGDKSESEVIRNGGIDQVRLRAIANDARLFASDPRHKRRYQKALSDAVQWHIKHNELASAQALMEPYLRLEPENLEANLTLGWLHIKQGQYQLAENIFLKARIKNDRSPDLHYLLGMAFYLQDKNELASRALRQSLELWYRPEVDQLLRKIKQENQAENDFRQANSLHFVVRYEGTATNHVLGQGILASLERAFSELSTELNYSPRESIAVVLYPNEVFQDVTRTPSWVGALNDGKIRFPIKGLSFVDEDARRILKHELTHSFIRLKTSGNCPVWLNEGLAQYLSGESSRQFVALAKQAITQKRFPALSNFEGPFLTMPVPQAAWAYQESLLAAEFLVKTYGLADVQTLLLQSGQGGSFAVGLKAALRRDYIQLQAEFEEYIKQL